MDANKHLVQKNDPKDLGITCQKPKFAQYAVVSKRFESYKTWPDYLPIKPEVLVEAGLVYTGVGDSVRCYFCGGGLRNWERGDSPWFEHAKWYPKCPHVLLTKGQGYVDRIARGENPDFDEVKKKSEHKPRQEEENLNTPAALSCMENGFSKSKVEKAIATFIRTRGHPYFKGEDLCKIIFQQEEEEELEKCKKEHSRPVGRNVMDRGASASAAEGTAEDLVKPADDKENTEDDEDFDELYEENRRLKESKLCKICLEDTSSIIFLPCGHMVSCPQCAPALVKCPMCRRVVQGFVKAHFADLP